MPEKTTWSQVLSRNARPAAARGSSWPVAPNPLHPAPHPSETSSAWALPATAAPAPLKPSPASPGLLLRGFGLRSPISSVRSELVLTVRTMRAMWTRPPPAESRHPDAGTATGCAASPGYGGPGCGYDGPGCVAGPSPCCGGPGCGGPGYAPPCSLCR